MRWARDPEGDRGQNCDEGAGRDDRRRIAFSIRDRRRHLGDRSDEAVSLSGDGDDVAVLVRLFAEDAPKRGDVLTEIVLFDGGVGPDGLHELLFGPKLSTRFDECQQRGEDLGLERYRFTVVV